MATRKHHVLYIEDHDDTRELVALVLSGHNYHVTTGATLADALRLAGEHHFDLYMLDSWLPDGSGLDLCKRLCELDPGVPIMFFSGAAYEADKETAIRNGAQGYMIKPADLNVLCSEVSRLIDVREKARSGRSVGDMFLESASFSEGEAGFDFPGHFTIRH